MSKRHAPLEAAALYRLMAWLSPAYPIGAFSYSSGIEWAVEAGDISDAMSLRRWLTVMIAEGGGFCDAVFFVHAHRAAGGDDDAVLRAVAELAAAFAPSKERHLETTAQGRAFLDTTRAAWPCAALDRLHGSVGRRHRAADRGRRRLRGTSHAAGAGASRLSPRAGREPHFGRRAARSARADRRSARACGARAGDRRDRGAGARHARSTTSAAPRSAPTSPACATRPSTRGCSGAERCLARMAPCASASAARSAPARPR